MVQVVYVFRHIDAEQLALEVDASRLLISTMNHLQLRSRFPCFLAVVDNMVAVCVCAEQNRPERDVARLDVHVGRSRVGEGWLRLSVHDVPDGLRQEHAAHVTTLIGVLIPIELVDEDTGRGVAGRHGAWAQNLWRLVWEVKRKRSGETVVTKRRTLVT